MATKLENTLIESAHFTNFVDRIPGIDHCCKTTINHLLALGLIQVSTAFEHAIAETSGLEVISVDHADLSDGSDGKLATVRTCGYGQRYSANISNVHGKTGSLRVQVYERKQNQFFYFTIPAHAYSHVRKTSNIDIPFELDGTPRRIPIRTPMVNWWDYEVSNFDEMASN